jgi:hypothetical protein
VLAVVGDVGVRRPVDDHPLQLPSRTSSVVYAGRRE